jgi:hypothetical protein
LTTLVLPLTRGECLLCGFAVTPLGLTRLACGGFWCGFAVTAARRVDLTCKFR